MNGRTAKKLRSDARKLAKATQKPEETNKLYRWLKKQYDRNGQLQETV